VDQNDSESWLNNNNGRLDNHWNGDNRFVFRSRKSLFSAFIYLNAVLFFIVFYSAFLYNINMSKDWSKIYKKYKGLWVALADDELTVLSSGQKLSEVILKAKKKGNKDPIMMRVPDNMNAYVGGFC
jgi:hypothetical protein